ncbi:MAG: 16S rRNA (cytidine(1402)-2'-O)-methyltransferase [Lachnospiraceae bacterium]|nr:16S rRNA (cytidine(1402)-2'-O)-methyltransferase [Lachnospiraceae bacterium]
MAGMLYICATPIGNLEDITFRTIRILKEADLIAAEDTRHSIKLLNHFEIKTPMTSYHEYNKYDKAKLLVDKMAAGMNIALITDAGTPAISDPGEELVKQCLEAGITVTSLPGPSAFVTALTLSGRSTRRFCFEAFLPYDKKDREEILQELKTETRTIILYEAPHKLKRTLKDLYEALGDRKISLCRELTKKHETNFCTTLAGAVIHYDAEEPRGEFVLVIEGADRKELKEQALEGLLSMSIPDHVQYYMEQGIDKKDAMKKTAKDRGIGKRDVYQALLDAEIRNECAGEQGEQSYT